MTTPFLFMPVFRAFDNSGAPLAGGLLYTYIAGTTNDKATYSDAAGLVPNQNPVILDATGSATVRLIPGAYHFLLTDSTGATTLWDEDYYSAPYLTASDIVGLLNPQTAAEVTAGVTPVNLQYPPMYVDRYSTNGDPPGTIDMAPAFSAAWQVALVAGGTIHYGATGLYGLSNPINFTTTAAQRSFGITVHCDTGFVPGNIPGPSLIPNHTGHVFDLTGSLGIEFENVAIGSGSAVPKTGIFQSRLASGASVGLCRFTNCSTLGSFSVASYYNYGAESDQMVGCFWNNMSLAANACCVAWTGSNYAALSSTFQTVATGTVSSIDHKVFGGEIYMQSNTNTADCIHLEQSHSLKIYGTWMLCGTPTGGGRSLINVDMAVPGPAPSWVSLKNITGEENGTNIQQYGILFSDNNATPSTWDIDSCKLTNLTKAIATGGLNPILDNFRIRNTSYQAGGGGLSVNRLQNSNIDSGAMPLTIGTSANNVLSGYTEQWTITTRSKDTWIEQGTANRTFAPGVVTAVNGWTAVGGAITQRGKLDYVSNEARFSIVIAGATSIAAAANATIPMPFTVIDSASATVTDTTGAALGFATLSGSTLTFPTAITTNTHTVIIQGFGFLA
jgi:hypothetical protein